MGSFPPLELVVARARNGVIGRDGVMPWHNSDDLRWFARYTRGQVVVMGRRTYDNLPHRPLKGRVNIVLSRQADNIARTEEPEPSWVPSIEEALERSRRLVHTGQARRICIIGGAAVFRLFLDDPGRFCGQDKGGLRAVVTQLDDSYPGDTTFPDLRLRSDWRMVSGPSSWPQGDRRGPGYRRLLFVCAQGDGDTATNPWYEDASE